MSERNQRKVYTGRVVSDKMDKTITVLVETQKKHPLYGKRVKYSKKYKAHDEQNEAKIGDIVRIMETRPLSATKSFRLVEVTETAFIIYLFGFIIIPKGGYTHDSTRITFKRYRKNARRRYFRSTT
jgi:small subunit ribosomal protein S17